MIFFKVKDDSKDSVAHFINLRTRSPDCLAAIHGPIKNNCKCCLLMPSIPHLEENMFSGKLLFVNTSENCTSYWLKLCCLLSKTERIDGMLFNPPPKAKMEASKEWFVPAGVATFYFFGTTSSDSNGQFPFIASPVHRSHACLCKAACRSRPIQKCETVISSARLCKWPPANWRQLDSTKEVTCSFSSPYHHASSIKIQAACVWNPYS